MLPGLPCSQTQPEAVSSGVNTFTLGRNELCVRALACFIAAGAGCAVASTKGLPWATTQPAPAGDAATAGGYIACPGTPGGLAVWGTDATILAFGQSGDHVMPVAAAAMMGRGRVVAFGHTSLLGSETLKVEQTQPFIDSLLDAAVTAATKTGGPAPVAVLVNSDLGEYLKTKGWSIGAKGGDWSQQLAHAQLLVLVGNNLQAEQVDAIRAFVLGGGHALLAQTAWAWKAPGDESLAGNPLNQITAGAGIAWTGDYISKVDGRGLKLMDPSDAVAGLLHAQTAWDYLLQAEKPSGAKPAKPDAAAAKKLSQAGFAVAAAARSLPEGDQLLAPKIDAARTQRPETGAAIAGISHSRPLKSSMPVARAMVAYDAARFSRLAPSRITAHPSAGEFPGPIELGALRQTSTQQITLPRAGWLSLGLYAPAGEVITVELTGDIARTAGLAVQIGCHTDQLWHQDSWERIPDITVRAKIADGKATIASRFGGLVYVIVPDERKKMEKSEPSRGEITVAGAVASPLFIRGKTDLTVWREAIRLAPGPWAELASENVIVSVPSQFVRTLDDPEALMRTWDQVLDAAADLATIPHERVRPERYVADVKISAGYMHSGYPIMTHLDAAADMTSEAKLRKGTWGLFHELGHNHQAPEWTFDGTTEVTCNLFSLYILDSVCGVSWTDGHGGMKDRATKLRKHLDTGAKFENWKKDPFLALQMYAQLVEAFGWDTYKKVFAEYRDLPKDQRPKGEQQERDQWMVRFAKACGKNLGPFFDAWGVPVSAEAKASITSLPAWMPADWPEAGK